MPKTQVLAADIPSPDSSQVSAVQLEHLHTYFLFPFAIDKSSIQQANPDYWKGGPDWITGLDEWIASMTARSRPPLGGWWRSAYDHFDLDSPAYGDMVFFHPFVRRVFFDTRHIGSARNVRQPLMRCYAMSLDPTRPVTWTIEDSRSRVTHADVTDLRMFLFANGIGILSIGVERRDIEFSEALYLNEMMRKVFPSSGRQRREGRVPARSTLTLTRGGREELIAEETFLTGDLTEFHPPLSKLVRSLLYFLNYDRKEYEQVLDERMIVYSYGAIASPEVPPEGPEAKLSEILLSQFLYVDRNSKSLRYDPTFTAQKLRKDVYRRWAHEGTLYGFTRYSNVTLTRGICDRGEHLAVEGALIHRMFDTRYYLMAVVALFYRAALLNLAERVALVSEELYRSQERGAITRDDIYAATRLRADFLHFSNYWYFDELANKDEEIEHFTMQCKAYRLEQMRSHIEEEVEKLNSFLHEHNQVRSTEAVNRLAMLSMILGGGAVMTGYFGMNFGREFSDAFFQPRFGADLAHRFSITAVSAFSLFSILLGVYVIVANWRDYRDTFRMRRDRG
ncbi:MAG: hypothetical protein H7039_00135 [Bryobacteraceae bacterium]|nr:hypothetical protein [Bryobacteraceae bacterium]